MSRRLGLDIRCLRALAERRGFWRVFGGGGFSIREYSGGAGGGFGGWGVLDPGMGEVAVRRVAGDRGLGCCRESSWAVGGDLRGNLGRFRGNEREGPRTDRRD